VDLVAKTTRPRSAQPTGVSLRVPRGLLRSALRLNGLIDQIVAEPRVQDGGGGASFNTFVKMVFIGARSLPLAFELSSATRVNNQHFRPAWLRQLPGAVLGTLISKVRLGGAFA
jgi:hypothetical protein